MLCVCVCSITVNSSLNLPKFDHCKSCKFLLEFIGVVVVVVVVVLRLRVSSITVRFSLLFSEFLPLV